VPHGSCPLRSTKSLGRCRLHHRLFAGPAGVFGPMRHDHSVLRRDHVEPLGRVLADHMHGRAAARAIGVLGRNRHMHAPADGREARRGWRDAYRYAPSPRSGPSCRRRLRSPQQLARYPRTPERAGPHQASPCLSCSRTSVARLSAPRRKSTGFVATSTRTPAGTVIMSPLRRPAAPPAGSGKHFQPPHRLRFRFVQKLSVRHVSNPLDSAGRQSPISART
jgi:hypothetical protein